METTDVDLRHVQLLKWPEDASVIGQLDLIEMQCWYAGQEPRRMVFLGQDREFVRFWRIHYLWPLKFKRTVYKVRRWFINIGHSTWNPYA